MGPSTKFPTGGRAWEVGMKKTRDARMVRSVFMLSALAPDRVHFQIDPDPCILPGMKDKLTEAFRFAMDKHHGQLRKLSARPFVYHPFAVAVLVLQYGGTDEQAQAAFVHDTIGEVSEAELA